MPSLCSGGPITIHSSRTLDTLGRGGPFGPDTLGVTLRYFAEGAYDTVWEIDTVYDTSRVPLDIVLAIDLSTSMAGIDSAVDSTKRPRIVWAKLAALHFLDSLKSGDRVAVMGWTAAGTPSGLSDTANPARYFHKWCDFTPDFSNVRAFLRDSLFIDSTKRILDTCEGQILVVRDNIPNGTFTTTPLRISTVVAADHLSLAGRPAVTRTVIMLTDGINNDGLARSVPVAVLDSLRRTQGQQFNAIGFISGDTAELHALTNAGGGYCYNAANPGQLDSIYAKLAGQLVQRKIDTTYSMKRIQIKPDTVRMPIDVILAIDLSASMDDSDGTSHKRIAWAKIAALGFLDSLKSQDRVAVLGWTSSSWGNIILADTAYPSLIYQKWCPFTSNLDNVRSFIRDSLYLDDNDGKVFDTIGGIPMTVWGDIPGPSQFGYTPLNIASILTMSHLSSTGRPGATKVVIMLTDGINNDSVPRSTAISFIDSLRRTQGLQMYTIGFVNGDTSELHSLALAGGGSFYNAKDNVELQNAYASLAHQLVTEQVAARKLMIQEVLQHPPLNFMTGTQTVTANSTVPLDKFESLTEGIGNTVLRWYFKTIPIWGTAEVFYKVVATQGANTVIGVDSAHAGGGFWSQMVYTDNAYDIITINLPASGSDKPVAVLLKGETTSSPCIAFRPGGIVRLSLGEHYSVAMTLYNLSGRIVYRTAARFSSPGNCAQFTIPKTVPAGIYAACFVFDNLTIRKIMNNIFK
ncbi:MAG: VWA domain-containing protein [Chitinispirillaceae bacterium]